jgi:hypothetical protein
MKRRELMAGAAALAVAPATALAAPATQTGNPEIVWDYRVNIDGEWSRRWGVAQTQEEAFSEMDRVMRGGAGVEYFRITIRRA